jgi:hypothetical protein
LLYHVTFAAICRTVFVGAVKVVPVELRVAPTPWTPQVRYFAVLFCHVYAALCRTVFLGAVKVVPVELRVAPTPWPPQVCYFVISCYICSFMSNSVCGCGQGGACGAEGGTDTLDTTGTLLCCVILSCICSFMSNSVLGCCQGGARGAEGSADTLATTGVLFCYIMLHLQLYVEQCLWVRSRWCLWS